VGHQTDNSSHLVNFSDFSADGHKKLKSENNSADFRHCLRSVERVSNDRVRRRVTRAIERSSCPTLRPPSDGCRFEERIRDLERSLREKRRALRKAAAPYRHLAFRRFEETLFAQPRVFPTKRKQLLVRSALDNTTVIKHENLICVDDSGKQM